MEFDDLRSAQIQLLHDPKTYDLTIRCQGREWKCQSGILTQRCDFFKAACSNSFKESAIRIIDLKEDDPEAVENLLEYLYTLEIPKCKNWKTNIQSLILADKYNISKLRVNLEEQMKMRIRVCLVEFGSASVEFKDLAMEIIVEVWECDIANRADIVAFIMKIILRDAKAFNAWEPFRELLSTRRDFMLAYVDALAAELASV